MDPDLQEPEEELTEEEARQHWLNRLILDGEIPNAVTWDDPSAADAGSPPENVKKSARVEGEELLDAMRVLAQRLLDAELSAPYFHLTKAYLAVNRDDVDGLVNEVAATKAALPAGFVNATVQNLLAALGQMVGLTIQQLRSGIGASTSLAGSSQLRASLGLQSSPNLAGWPTL